MRRESSGMLISALLVAIGGCASAGTIADPSEQVDIAGTWVLDEDDSRMPDPARRREGEGGPPASGIPGGEMRRGGRGGMSGRGGMNRFDPAEIERVMRRVTESRARLGVEQTDSTVVLSYANGAQLDLVPDGEEREHVLTGFGEVKAKARWKDGVLNVERKLDGDTTIKDEFTRSAGSSRLVVTTKLAPGGLPRELTFISVYDLDESGS